MNEKFKDEIIEFVKENPRINPVDVISHFDLRVSAVLDAISELEKEKRLERAWVGYKYELKVLDND